jgi:hypothetical protein
MKYGKNECDLREKIGNLTYIISGKEYTLTPEDFLTDARPKV